jgi:DNA invertase Pin-like site-specific DNA recombinase
MDTITPTGRLVFHILGAIDEFQRELIVEDTREGVARAWSGPPRLTAGRPPGQRGRRPDPQAAEMIGQVLQRGCGDSGGESVFMQARHHGPRFASVR